MPIQLDTAIDIRRTVPVENTFIDILLPSNSGNAFAECSILVQIDPDESNDLDFVGATGAVGRLEADGSGGEFCFYIMIVKNT